LKNNTYEHTFGYKTASTIAFSYYNTSEMLRKLIPFKNSGLKYQNKNVVNIETKKILR